MQAPLQETVGSDPGLLHYIKHHNKESHKNFWFSSVLKVLLHYTLLN